MGTLYLSILSGIIYLLYISLRGALGLTLQHTKGDRYKFDAIDFYMVDLAWFSFIFIMFCMGLITIVLKETGRIIYVPAHGSLAKTSGLLHLLYITTGIRFFQLLFMRDLKEHSKNEIRPTKDIPMWVWFIQILAYLYVFIRWVENATSAYILRTVIEMDMIMFVF